MAASGRKQTKKSKHPETELKKAFDFDLEEKKGSGSEEDPREDETPIVEKLSKKRAADSFDDLNAGVGNEVQSMLERFGADISKAMQTKRKRLEVLTKTSLKGSTQKLEQMWKTQQNQRQKLTQEHSQQLLSVLQQWEIDVQKSEEQEEKLNVRYVTDHLTNEGCLEFLWCIQKLLQGLYVSTEYAPPAAEAFPAGEGCTKPKDEDHQGTSRAVHQEHGGDGEEPRSLSSGHTDGAP